LEPGQATVIDLALIALGAVLGALLFSVVIGGHRARQLARLTDRLAQATGAPTPLSPMKYPDRIVSTSIERLAARIAEVESQASTDPLTRLLNRQACLAVLETEIERANRYGRPLAVALIDIDHFKRVNDTHGHAVGDEVLRKVAGLLRSSVRAVDSLGRYGGEEFLLVMPETDVGGGLATAENLRRAVAREKIAHGDVGVSVTMSAGVAGGASTEPLDVDRILRQADSALYSAKALGRDQLQAYRPVDDDSGVRRAAISVSARNQAAKLGREAFDASSRRLLSALSSRNGWTGAPSKLIAALAADIARAVGLPDGDVDRIRTASLLHDLGKLAVSEKILSKPGPLNQAEWRAIVEHPKIGQVVLEQAGAIRDAAAIVLHHHEWYDGRGYPYGLAGDEIPVGARILAIADAYEAMISDRPYQAALSHVDAVKELRRAQGTQFDPDLVEIFVSLFGAGTPSRSAVASGSARRR
jgi:diguanylate cyclase (GGDEF)-like protein